MEQSSVIAALAALAQESRLEVFRLLVQAGDGGVPAGKIAQALSVPNNTLSFHLDRLRHAGLVTQRREGRSIIYVADYAAMASLVAYLTENCCQGLVEDCGPSDCTTGRSPPAKARRRPAPARSS